MTAPARFSAILAGLIRQVNAATNDSGPAAREFWLRVPFGERPNTFTASDGKVRDGVQIVDEDGAERMAAEFNRVLGGGGTPSQDEGALAVYARMIKGAPVYEGHPDDPGWRGHNSGVASSLRSFGRVKKIRLSEGGMEMLTSFNDEGLALVTGDAPAYSGYSPRFDFEEIPGRPGAFRAISLISLGLTDRPNIPETFFALNGVNESPGEAATAGQENQTETETEPTTNMTPELLARLGFAADATPTPEEISAAVTALLDEVDSLKASNAEGEKKKEEATAANMADEKKEEDKPTAANSMLEPHVITAVNSALHAGQITPAEVPHWRGELRKNFAAGLDRLNSEKKPGTAFNSQSKLPGNLGARRGSSAGGDTISKIRAYCSEHNMDPGNEADYRRAYAAVSKAS